jgi:hypothetical protein
MSSYHDNRYEEIKSLVRQSRLINEQMTGRINIAKSIEDKIEDDEYETASKEGDKEKQEEDKVEKYRISGNILAIHGKDNEEMRITSDDKLAFQETIDEFTEEVSDLVDFNQLNLYRNNVEWSGKIIDQDMDFIFTIGESNGIYINADAVKVDPEFLDSINKLQKYYEKFKSKWSKLIAQRKINRQEED